MKVRISKKLLSIAAVSLMSMSMVVYAATLFTQSFPAQTFATPTLAQGTACGGGGASLVLVPTGTQNPGYTGSPATFEYACDASGDAAFVVEAPTGGTGPTVTPTFSVPQGWSLAIVQLPNNCASSPGSALASGTSLSLMGGTSYDYCLTTNSATNFASFSITWSQ